MLSYTWDGLPLSVRSKLLTKAVDDRSLTLYKLAQDLKGTWLSPEQRYIVLAGTNFNKFRKRPQYLWKMVQGEK